MSEAPAKEKAGDKPHGDDHGHGAKKETAGNRVWKAAGDTLVIVIGVIVLIFLLKATFPMISSNLTELVQNINQGLLQLGVQLRLMGVTLRSFVTSAVSVLVVVIFGVAIAYATKMLIDAIQKKFKKGGGDKDAH